MLALMISTCILPNVEAVSNLHIQGPNTVFESPHTKMSTIIEMAWAFSTVLGILLFLGKETQFQPFINQFSFQLRSAFSAGLSSTILSRTWLPGLLQGCWFLFSLFLLHLQLTFTSRWASVIISPSLYYWLTFNLVGSPQIWSIRAQHQGAAVIERPAGWHRGQHGHP